MHDGWPVDGHAPKELPAGRATGRDMAVATQGSRSATLGAGEPSTSPARSSAPDASAPRGRQQRRERFVGRAGDHRGAVPVVRHGPRHEDASADPSAAPTDDAAEADAADAADAADDPSATAAPSAAPADVADAADAGSTTSLDPDGSLAPSAAAGLRRQVFGFLPYWELSGAASSLHYDVLSTIAYFSVGADETGNLKKRNSNGTTTTGWGGWTSSSMTRVINAAHAARTPGSSSRSACSPGRPSQAARPEGASSAARPPAATLARQIAAAVRDRGADGVNLDFEPLASGYEDEFVALLRTSAASSTGSRPATSSRTTRPASSATTRSRPRSAPGAADAIFVMGYDYRTAGSSTAGSIDPLSGPSYDLARHRPRVHRRGSPRRG